MPNPNAPNGFQYLRKLDGGAGSGQVNSYPIQSGYNTTISVGDPVTTAGGYINRANATNIVLGVFMGVTYKPAAGGAADKNQWLAGTLTLGNAAATALICDDVNAVFVARYGGAANTPNVADQTKSFMSGGQGNYTADGRSQVYLDQTTANASGTGQWVAVGYLPQPVGGSGLGNDTTSAYPLMMVRMGNAIYKGSLGT